MLYIIYVFIYFIYIYIHNINIHNSYIHNINTCIFLFIFINFFLLVTFLLFTASIATPNNENTRIYNLGQNIWNKMEKSSKTGQEKKSLASFLVFFFWLLLPKSNSLKGDSELGNVSTKIWHFPDFLRS